MREPYQPDAPTSHRANPTGQISDDVRHASRRPTGPRPPRAGSPSTVPAARSVISRQGTLTRAALPNETDRACRQGSLTDAEPPTEAMSRRLSDAERQRLDECRQDVERRQRQLAHARWFLDHEIRRLAGPLATHPVSVTDVARTLGISRESVYQAMKRAEQDRWPTT